MDAASSPPPAAGVKRMPPPMTFGDDDGRGVEAAEAAFERGGFAGACDMPAIIGRLLREELAFDRIAELRPCLRAFFR
jgi:hypothetical protein